MQPFTVNLSEAIKFSKVWNINGIAVPISESSCQFATDFANVVLNNFINICQQKARESALQALEGKKKPILIEGTI